MTNYEWLLNMGGEERQAWFDAQHEANDTLSAENDVTVDGMDANDTCDALDSREKLESEVRFIAAINEDDEKGRRLFEDMIINLLDRQAAIAHREAFMCGRASLDDEFAECADEIAELTAQVDELSQQLTNARADCEQYRELLSEAIRYAHEIVNLQP